MKVYIIIYDEDCKGGFIPHYSVCSSKKLALKEVKKIIASCPKEDGWKHNAKENIWTSKRGDMIDILEKELIEE